MWNISFEPSGNEMLDCIISITPAKTISLQTELEELTPKDIGRNSQTRTYQ